MLKYFFAIIFVFFGSLLNTLFIVKVLNYSNGLDKHNWLVSNVPIVAPFAKALLQKFEEIGN